MNLPCVVKGYLNAPRVEQYASVLADSLLVAVVLAPLLLYLYRRRVIQLMGGVLQTGVTASRPVQSTLPDEFGPGGLALAPNEGLSDPTESLETAGRQRARQLAHAVMKTVLVFVAVTIATQLVLKWQAGTLFGRTPIILSIAWFIWLLLVVGISWPMVVLGTANPRFARWFLFVTVPCFLLDLAIGFSPHLSRRELSIQVQFAVFFLLMCVGLGSRHMRNVVPTLMLALGTVLLIMLEASFVVGNGISTCLGPSSADMMRLRLIAWVALFCSH